MKIVTYRPAKTTQAKNMQVYWSIFRAPRVLIYILLRCYMSKIERNNRENKSKNIWYKFWLSIDNKPLRNIQYTFILLFERGRY